MVWLLRVGVVALVVYGVVEARGVWRVWTWAAQTPDRVVRRLLLASAWLALALAAALSARGVPPPASAPIAGLAFLGAVPFGAGALRVERALVETSFEAALRVLARERPSSSRASRAVAMSLGAIVLGGAAILAALAW